jgi:hypothetical protein
LRLHVNQPWAAQRKQAAHLSEFGSALSLPPQSQPQAGKPCRPQRRQSHRRRRSRPKDSSYLQFHSNAGYLRRCRRREPANEIPSRSRCLLTFTADLRVICCQCDLSLGSMTGQGVVWDQQYKHDRENPEKEHRTCQQNSTHKYSPPPSSALNKKSCVSTRRSQNSGPCWTVAPLEQTPRRKRPPRSARSPPPQDDGWPLDKRRDGRS